MSLTILKSKAEEQDSNIESLLALNQTLKDTADELKERINTQAIDSAKQETEILVKSELIERIIKDKTEEKNLKLY